MFQLITPQHCCSDHIKAPNKMTRKQACALVIICLLKAIMAQEPSNFKGIGANVAEYEPLRSEIITKKKGKLSRNPNKGRGDLMVDSKDYSMVHQPDIKCPGIFAYKYNSQENEWYGEIGLNKKPGLKLYELEVNMTIPKKVKIGHGIKLSLLSSKNEVMKSTPIRWTVKFPYNDVLPKLVMVKYNGKILCSDLPDPVLKGRNYVMMARSRITTKNPTVVKKQQDPHNNKTKPGYISNKPINKPKDPPSKIPYPGYAGNMLTNPGYPENMAPYPGYKGNITQNPENVSEEFPTTAIPSKAATKVNTPEGSDMKTVPVKSTVQPKRQEVAQTTQQTTLKEAINTNVTGGVSKTIAKDKSDKKVEARATTRRPPVGMAVPPDSDEVLY